MSLLSLKMKNVQLLNFSAPVFDLDNRELIIEGKIRNTTEMRFMYEKINITRYSERGWRTEMVTWRSPVKKMFLEILQNSQENTYLFIYDFI